MCNHVLSCKSTQGCNFLTAQHDNNVSNFGTPLVSQPLLDLQGYLQFHEEFHKVVASSLHNMMMTIVIEDNGDCGYV